MSTIAKCLTRIRPKIISIHPIKNIEACTMSKSCFEHPILNALSKVHVFSLSAQHVGGIPNSLDQSLASFNPQHCN